MNRLTRHIKVAREALCHSIDACREVRRHDWRRAKELERSLTGLLYQLDGLSVPKPIAVQEEKKPKKVVPPVIKVVL